MAIRIDDVDLDRDRALVQRFQAGDGAAFDELYGRYRHRLERFCLKRVGDHHAAEEVAQEAFTRALAALPKFAGERRFYPWVSVIASRLCVDHHRSQARSELSSEVSYPWGVPGGQDEIVEAVDAELVTTAMARLGPRHQDVLRLREVERWSYRRIADHYQVPIGTIETLLFRARRALRREFDIIDGAGLAAIPFLGSFLHGIGRIRDRLAPLASMNPAQSGLAAAATATVAAVAIAIAPPTPASTPPPAAAAGHVAAAPATGPPGQPAPARSPGAQPPPSRSSPPPAAIASSDVIPTGPDTATTVPAQAEPAAGDHGAPVPVPAHSVVTSVPPASVPATQPPTTVLPPVTVPSASTAIPAVALPSPVPGAVGLPVAGPASGLSPTPQPTALVPTVPDAVGPLLGNLRL